MARTTTAKVRGLLEPGGDYDTLNEPDLTPFIATASVLVDDLVECLTSKGLTYSASKLELIERWLAAHYYQQSDKGYTQRSTLRASGSFQGRTDMYLENTLYGQTAVRLDKSGCLSSIAGAVKKQAGGFWAGKRPSEQTNYEDRD